MKTIQIISLRDSLVVKVLERYANVTTLNLSQFLT